MPAMPRNSYVPSHIRGREVAVDPEGTDMAIWTWEDGGRLMGIAFRGKSNKPYWHHRFRDEAERDRHVQKTLEIRKQQLADKAKAVQQRREFRHDVQVGDIYYTSWGYDQTQVDFYEVVDIRGKQLLVRRIATTSKSADRGVEYVVAVPGKFVGPEMRVTATPHGFKVENHYARKWDGRPKYQTSMGWGH